ncbi:OprD family outer membrane porin [Enterobacteriaceae bacterium YMB-R22]|jgi:hypothetical protein|uniref:OprD family outer membrane porin n=1 Tax=Tenebrionicola larvae TaxID=2815733 RepID=UPI0020122817|nr:OprD family outer membrane porin [Tenebrionicola larvae]MBV4411990.1 OprD family outer membrane porin [Tenebrionicola larvae]
MIIHSRLYTLLLLTGCGMGIYSNTASAGGGGFLEKSRLDLTLKNVWMLNTTNQLADLGIGEQNAWAQGIHLDFQSGWYKNTLGIDASWYGVAKLYASDAFYGRDLLRDNNGKAEGFNKIGQIYARAKFGDEEHYLRMYAGWRQLYKFGMLNVTRSRAVPSSYEGLSVESRWRNVDLRAAVVQRFSERDEPEKRHFLTLKTNKRINYIATGDIRWKPRADMQIQYRVGESDNYLLRQGVEFDGLILATQGGDVFFRGAYYHNRGLSRWEGARGFTRSAQHYYGQLGYRSELTESALALSHTRAKYENGLGHFYWHFGKNTRGAFNSPADGEGNDYINDGEKMIHAYSQYKILPNLVLGIFGHYGFGTRYQNVDLKEWEYGGYFSWSPQSVSGLNVFGGVGPAYTWKVKGGAPSLTDNKDGYHRAKGIGATLRVEYKIGLFE